MIKILYLIKTSEGAKWALELLNELKKTNLVEIHVAMPLGGRYTEQYENICDGLHHIEYGINTKFLLNAYKLKQIINVVKPDLIHSWFTQCTFFARLPFISRGIPRIFQVVGPLHLEYFLFRYFDVFSARKNDFWIPGSKYIKNKYLECGVHTDKLFLNYPYQDANRMIKSGENIRPINIREKYKIDKNVKIIGTASYFYKPKKFEKVGVKGHEYLLDAFQELLNIRNDVHLFIAGSTFGRDESYRNKILTNAIKRFGDKVTFHGNYSHIKQIIQAMDVFVFLSKSENLGGVFESLFYGIPTIASNRGALPEMVMDNITGFSVDPSNSKIVAEKISFMLNNTEITKHMVEEGKKTVLSFLNGSENLNKTISIYKKILEM